MNNEMTMIEVQHLHPFREHPYQVRDDAEMDALVESIQSQGILDPLIVRPLENTENEYEVISGHRRLHAAQKAGIQTVPAFIHDVSRDEASIQLVDCNLHREHILPSEKAFAYKLKYEAMRHQGTSSQLGTKLRADEEMATQVGESRNQIHRYIRLTNLIPSLLKMMDEGRIAFSIGVELSYLSELEQCDLVDAIYYADCTPSLPQALELKQKSQNGTLQFLDISAVLSQPKPNQKERITFKTDDLRKFFPKDSTPEKMQETIMKLLEDYDRKRRRAYER